MKPELDLIILNVNKVKNKRKEFGLKYTQKETQARKDIADSNMRIKREEESGHKFEEIIEGLNQHKNDQM